VRLAATAIANMSTQKSIVQMEDSKAPTAASNASFSIDDDSRSDTFFYAFVGLTILMGLLGLIWPACILYDKTWQAK
jgi:hypothetical protein